MLMSRVSGVMPGLITTWAANRYNHALYLPCVAQSSESDSSEPGSVFTLSPTTKSANVNESEQNDKNQMKNATTAENKTTNFWNATLHTMLDTGHLNQFSSWTSNIKGKK